MATKVKTEADTDMPWTRLLTVQVTWPKGQPVEKSRTGLSKFILK